LQHVVGLANEELSATLMPSERKLCERLHVLSITGKRTVPLLLTADLKKAMDVIANAEMRAAVGVSPSNVYVFARTCISSLHSFRGSDCLKKCAVAAECEQPETVTSKYTCINENCSAKNVSLRHWPLSCPCVASSFPPLCCGYHSIHLWCLY